MLLSFNEVSEKIEKGQLLHIAGTEDLLRKLPKGNWVGGSTEYFMSEDGGKITNEKLFISEFPYSEFKLSSYDEKSIYNVAVDAYDNGFSIVILPFDSVIHKTFADKAPEFKSLFMKNIAGWISGLNLNEAGQTPITVNGLTGEVSKDKGVVIHIEVPADKRVSLGIVNIFEQDNNSPVIQFPQEGFSAKTCMVDGKEVVFTDFIEQNKIDTKLPLIGDYSGQGINVSFKSIDDGMVSFYAPVFPHIQYRMAKTISNYVERFNNQLDAHKSADAEFSCNCILNFLYGELENKDIEKFFGPITFGEIAYQLVNQTLVYVTVS